MRCPPCPRCDRIDKVGKVTGIVAWGTQQSNSSSWQINPSFDEDGDFQWSSSYSSMSTESRSILVQQLTFPKKGETAWGVLCGLFLGSSLVGYVFLESSKLNPTSTLGSLTFDKQNFAELVFVGSVILLLMTIIVAYRFINGRADAQRAWDALYYCFRDDVVYLAHDPAQCAPPSMMRTAILHY